MHLTTQYEFVPLLIQGDDVSAKKARRRTSPRRWRRRMGLLFASLTTVMFLGAPSIEKERLSFQKAVTDAYADNWQADIYNEGLPSHLVAVDKERQSFLFFEKKSPLALKYVFPCTTGQVSGDKQVMNDLRTPEGIYFVQYKISGGLDFKEYGGIAYTLNYPNPVDKLRGKTGYGIWIHSKGFGIVPRDTRGCVAIGLQEIDTVGPRLTPGTAVVVAERIDETQVPQADDGTARMLRLLMQEWSIAWEERSERLFEFYNAEAYTKAMPESFAAFRKNKERLFKILDFIKIYNKEIYALKGPGYWVTWAEQLYTASNLSTEGIRRLYWQPDDEGRYRIVGMEWTPRDLGMQDAFQKGKLVAQSRLSLTDATELPTAPRLEMPESAETSAKPQGTLVAADPLIPQRRALPAPAEINWGAPSHEDVERQRQEEAARLAEQQRLEAEARAKLEAEEQARREAEAKAKAEAEAAQRAEQQRLEAEAKARAEAEAARLAEQQRLEAEAKAKAEAEAKARAEAEAARIAEQQRLEAEARAKAEAEAKARAEEEARARAEAEAARIAEQQRLEAEAKAKAEAEAKARAEAEAARLALTKEVRDAIVLNVKSWESAVAARNKTALAPLYEPRLFNKVKGVPRGMYYGQTLRDIERRYRQPVTIVSRGPQVRVLGEVIESRNAQMLLSGKEMEQGIRVLFWKKGDDGLFRIVGEQFEKGDQGLSAIYLETVSSDISRMIDGWRMAWERADLEAYMAFYSKDASQQGKYGARAIRRQKEQLWRRVTPTMVQLSGLRLVLDKGGIRADMLQSYADSAGRSDRGTKTLLLRQEGKEWRIVREDWSAAAPLPPLEEEQ